MFNFVDFFNALFRAGQTLLNAFAVVGHSFTRPVLSWVMDYDNATGNNAGEFLTSLNEAIYDLAYGEAESFWDEIVRAVIGPLLFYIYEVLSTSLLDIVIWAIPAVLFFNVLKKLWEALPLA